MWGTDGWSLILTGYRGGGTVGLVVVPTATIRAVTSELLATITTLLEVHVDPNGDDGE